MLKNEESGEDRKKAWGKVWKQGNKERKTRRTMKRKRKLRKSRRKDSYFAVGDKPIPMMDKVSVGRSQGEEVNVLGALHKGSEPSNEVIHEVHDGGISGGKCACLLLRRLFILFSASVSFWRSRNLSKAAHSSSSSALIQSSCSGPYGALDLTSYCGIYARPNVRLPIISKMGYSTSLSVSRSIGGAMTGGLRSDVLCSFSLDTWKIGWTRFRLGGSLMR
jgi:hypothetical protein